MGQYLADYLNALLIDGVERAEVKDALADLLLPTSYEGFLCNGLYVPKEFSAGATQMMVDNYHYLRDDVDGMVRVAMANFYETPNTGIEAGSGAAMTGSVSLIDASGNLIRFLFSGSTTYSVPNNSMLWSDPIYFKGKAGDRIKLRTFGLNANGLTYIGRGSGGVFVQSFGRFGTSGITDQTDSTAAITSGSVNGIYFGPVAFVGQTRKPSFLAFGDSRSVEQGGAGDISYNQGYGARGLGEKFAICTYAASGVGAATADADRLKGASLAAYASHFLSFLGYNGLPTDGTASAPRDNLFRLYAQIRAVNSLIKVYQATINPGSTSSDGWVTTANQTVLSNNASRIVLNNLIRYGMLSSNLPTIDGHIEIADHVETSRGSGIWLPNLTADGVHESPFGMQHIKGRANIADGPWMRATA